MSGRPILNVILSCVLLVSIPVPVLAQDSCPGNLLANASMEEGSRGAAAVGTRPSSIVVNAWNPWSVWGYSPYSQEAEFDVEDITRLDRYSTYRVHTGRYAQKFSTLHGLHTAGMYQRVAVPKGSLVTFSIWVQIYTGEESVISDSNNELISDLNHPGNYRTYVGVDPYGDEPPGFGAGPSERTLWSDPVLDRETRRVDDRGLPYDAWVQIQVQARAEADHVTVYTKGQPEFPVKFNVSYWDDACLTYVAPKPSLTATPTATNTSRPTPLPTYTPTVTATSTPTEKPLPTATPPSTETPLPTAIMTLGPTETLAPTATPGPTSTPTRKAAPSPARGETSDNPLLLAVFAIAWLSAAGYIAWTLWRKRQARAGNKPSI